MRHRSSKRLAALVLVVALAAPAAWAAPGLGEAGAWWVWVQQVWAWTTGHPAPAQKVGPCIDPAGKPAPCVQPAPAQKVGPCIGPDGNPAPCPKAGAPLGQDDEPAPRAWHRPALKAGPCIDPLGRPVPCAG